VARAVRARPRGGAAAPQTAGPAGRSRGAGGRSGRDDPRWGRAPRRRLDLAAAADRDSPPRWPHDLGGLAVPPAPQKGFAWRRPRHTLKGRQDAAAVAAGRQRLAALKRQAEAGAIDLVFLDESEARTHPYLARCWARKGTDLRIEAPGQAPRRALLGGFDPARRRLIVRTSATKRSADFVALLDDLGAAYGTRARVKPLVAVADNGPIHTSKLTATALAARPWLTIEWLPK
jgi:DDE superfamily endonuclease